MSWKLLPDKKINLLSCAQAFSPEEAQQLIDSLRGADHYSHTGNYFSYSSILLDPYVFPEVYDRVTSVVLDANVNNYGFKIQGIPALYYAEFQGSQFMDWSMDLSWSDRETNKLSVQVFLNDDFEGGEFLIRNPRDQVLGAKTGVATVFPSFVSSRQNPVTKGIKRAVIGTVTGLPFS